MKRRQLITSTSAMLVAPAVLLSGADEAKYRVGVIGATGRGNFGHGLDSVWLQVPNTTIVAVADASATGLKKAGNKLQCDQLHSEYQEMLAQHKPDLVAVCPRHPDQHADMILAAIDNGARGIYVEKPFVRTLKEADKIKQKADQAGTRIAIAHRNRYHPDLKIIDQILANKGEHKIGKLLEIRGRGKGDRRGGGEDLWVLGTHVLNLMQYFGGNPKSCSAQVFKKGKLVTQKDIYPGNEALGPLVGDEIHARYIMSKGIPAFFDSQINDGTKNKGFGLQLIGSEGTVIIHCDCAPLAHYRKGNPLDPTNPNRWQPIGNKATETIEQVQNHILPCRDLIESIETNRQPLCNLDQGIWTIEMVMAVFQSHFSGGQSIAMPMAQRDHPLSQN